MKGCKLAKELEAARGHRKQPGFHRKMILSYLYWEDPSGSKVQGESGHGLRYI